MANMTFKANLLPNSNLGYSLGSSDLKWKINDITLSMGTQNKLLKYGNNSIEDSNIVDIGNISYHTVTPEYTQGGEQFYTAYLSHVVANFTNGLLHMGTITPNSRGISIGHIYSVDLKDETTGLPQYSTFLTDVFGNLETFGTNNYSYYHRTYLSDNNYASYLDSRYVLKINSSTDNAIARFDGTNGQIQNSTATINDNGTMNIKGKLIVNPSYDTSTNSHNEGVRINQASNGWAEIIVGGVADSTSGTADSQWIVGRRGQAGSKVGAVGDFTIEEQDSTGAGLTIHKDCGGATLYTNKAADSGCFNIKNIYATAANRTGWAINALTPSMAAGSNSVLLVGQANSSGNQGYVGFHYAGAANNGNWVSLGLYAKDHLIKAFYSGYIATSGTTQFSNTTSWNGGTAIVGADGKDKAIVGYENGSVNGVVFGAHASSCTAWAPVNLSGTQVNFRNSDTLVGKFLDGCLSLFPTTGTYREGIRIHSASNNWCQMTLCGADNTGDSGISANSWFIGNNNGSLYITRGSSNGFGTSQLSCIGNVWSFGGIGTTSTGPYNEAALQIREYAKGGAQSDTWGIAPGLTWHWSGRVAAQIRLASNGYLYEAPVTGTSYYQIVIADGRTYNISISGNAATASLLKPIASTTTASASTWNIPSGSKQVWGERFSDSTLKYTPSGGSATTITDTGDWVMWLTPNATSNAATLNMRIDGTYYGSFSGNLTGNASTATKLSNTPNNTTTFLRGDNTWSNVLQCAAGSWSYLRLHNGSNLWDIATKSNSLSGALEFRPGGADTKGPYIATNGIFYGLGEICSKGLASSNAQFRAVYGNYGVMLRNDGSNTYFLLTASGDQYGSWNSLRPFYFNNADATVHMAKAYGAVWNDYAEFRETKEEIEPGRCIREVGDDTLILATERLQKGCEIVSDTFGFAIGKSDKAKTPTAASGRVLAYPYEDKEEFRKHIGDCVCSGPNGTVSIMTEEEERLYPGRIIGTISAVPDYEIWHAGHQADLEQEEIKVNGRIWIRIR